MRILLFALTSCLLFACSSLKQAQKSSRYFEGQVTYELEYAPHSSDVSPQQISEFVGVKMVYTINREGDYMKEFYAPNGDKLYTYYLNLEERKSFMKRADSDTLFWFDITVPDTKGSFEQLGDTVIDGHSCVLINAEYLFNNEKTIDEYIFARDLPINPEWYAEFRESNYAELAKMARGMFLERKHRGPYWVQYCKASSIVWRKVKKHELGIPNLANFPTKKL